MTGPVFLVSGVPGTGKSSVCDALMGRFDRGIHIPTDDIRSWVVAGYADPTQSWNDETDLQFRLSREGAARMGRDYSDAGFAVALDDVIWPAEAEVVFGAMLADRPSCRVLLHAPLEVTLQPNARRTNKQFHTSILEDTIRMLHGRVDPAAEQWSGWLVLDTSRMTIDETVEAILMHPRSGVA